MLLTVAILFGCTQVSKQKPPNQFTGLWSLLAMEQMDPETGEWHQFKNGMQGYILYDDKDNMAIHLTTVGYEATDLRFPNFTDSISIEALKHLTGSYVYFAKYSVDVEKGIVEHARISHSNPGQWNDIVPRRYTIRGDTLTLMPLDEEIPERLIWIMSASGKR